MAAAVELKARQTEQAKKRFLDAYARCGVIRAACRAARVGRTTYYEWTEFDPAFAAAAQIALTESGDRLEEHAIEWATVGLKTIKEVWERDGAGNLVLVRREHDRDRNATLLIFALKGAKPEKYRDRMDIHHSGGPPPIKTLGDEAWAAL